MLRAGILGTTLAHRRLNRAKGLPEYVNFKTEINRAAQQLHHEEFVADVKKAHYDNHPAG